MENIVTVIPDHWIQEEEGAKILKSLADPESFSHDDLHMNPPWAHLVKNKMMIPMDAVEYFHEDGEWNHWSVDWKTMYLDKIRQEPERAAELIAEYDRRKDTYQRLK